MGNSLMKDLRFPDYSYDLIPYESHAYSQTHPDRLFSLGRLFGLNPAPVDGCRVLELGCASGGNLIPMSHHLPKSEFMGIDLSGREVEMGRKTIAALGLNNITLRHMDIAAIDDSFGMFDYIIAHGVYSWVPNAVQDKILAISSEHLPPNGIAYISYNTYPGWHIREMIRHMMLYHTHRYKESKDRIEEARGLIDFLADVTPTANNYFGMLLKNELDVIKRAEDWYLFHDHLEENNSPVYFHQFMEQAEGYGLQYLAEANFSTMLARGFSEKVQKTLEGISRNIIDAEQYMDFLRNRLFRQTLLCHKDMSITRNVTADRLKGLLISSKAVTESRSIDFSSDVKQTFITNDGAWTKSDFPLTKAALAVLQDVWPRAMSLSELLKRARQRLNEKLNHSELDPDQEREMLGEDLLHCFSGKVVELHAWQADFSTEVSQTPMAAPLATYQATHDLPIVNLKHESVATDLISKELLKILDGTRNRDAILYHLIDCAHAGTLVLKENNGDILKGKKLNQAMANAMEDRLNNLAKIALLVK